MSLSRIGESLGMLIVPMNIGRFLWALILTVLCPSLRKLRMSLDSYSFIRAVLAYFAKSKITSTQAFRILHTFY